MTCIQYLELVEQEVLFDERALMQGHPLLCWFL